MSRVAEAVRGAVAEASGDSVVITEGFGVVTVDVARSAWTAAARTAVGAGATYFDFLTAYDELADGFAVLVHVSTPDAGDHVLLRTRVPREDASLASITEVYAGAAWHERETHEMFGIEFTGRDQLDPLLLPPGFSGHPLRKDFVLASRVAKPWPGDKDPADAGGRPRRRTLPPGVPTDWPPPAAEPPIAPEDEQ
jgi:NADH-quinone oxidoreductase subunit C